MRNHLLLATTLTLCAISTQSFGFIVEDIATERNTMMSYVKDAQSVINQATMIQHQVTSLQYQLRNLQNLSQLHWTNGEQSLNQLSGALNQVNSLNYTTNDLQSEYKKIYPGSDSKTATNDYQAAHKKWVATNQATMNGVLSQLQESNNQVKQESAQIDALKAQAKNPAGALQAAQIANELAAEQISQQQKLRATQMAAANAQAEYYAYQAQKDATTQQSVNQAVQGADDTYPQYQGKSEFGTIPEFGG